MGLGIDEIDQGRAGVDGLAVLFEGKLFEHAAGGDEDRLVKRRLDGHLLARGGGEGWKGFGFRSRGGRRGGGGGRLLGLGVGLRGRGSGREQEVPANQDGKGENPRPRLRVCFPLSFKSRR